MLSISIKKNGSNLAAFSGNSPLFDFSYREQLGSWCFWVRGRSTLDPIKKAGKTFPWELFVDLCRATSFLTFETPLYEGSEVVVVHGKSYIK